MTVQAHSLRVPSLQQKSGVVERCAFPAYCRGSMTAHAIRGESQFPVIGIVRGIVVREVAADTIRRKPGVDAAAVTVQAQSLGVPSLQQKSGVVERCASPGQV